MRALVKPHPLYASPNLHRVGGENFLEPHGVVAVQRGLGEIHHAGLVPGGFLRGEEAATVVTILEKESA